MLLQCDYFMCNAHDFQKLSQAFQGLSAAHFICSPAECSAHRLKQLRRTGFLSAYTSSDSSSSLKEAKASWS